MTTSMLERRESALPPADPDGTVQKRRRGGSRRRDGAVGLLLIAPAMAYFVVFLFYPALEALYYSFTNWNLRERSDWVGLANYRELLFDDVKYPFFWKSIRVTAFFTLLSVPLTLAVALGQALLLNSIKRGSTPFRLMLFLPVVTAEAAVGAIWRWLYDPAYGLVNAALDLVGIPPQNWLNTPSLVIPALSVIAAWQCGIAMLIFLAGLKGVPASIKEAAIVDGAGPLQRFWHITLPTLRPTTFYLTVTSVIASLQVFGLVYVIFSGGRGVSGGPEQSGLTYVLHLYLFAFRYDAMGAACAMSFILFTFILIITAVQFKFLKQEAE